jgi:hypothetical protein
LCQNKGRRGLFRDEKGYKQVQGEINKLIEQEVFLVLSEILKERKIEENAFNKAIEHHARDESVNHAFELLCIPEMYHFYEKYCYLESLGSILRPKMAIFKLQISFGFLETYE